MSCIIEIRNVSKLFGSHVALEEVELSINAGEIFGIIGKSGSGKSTLMRLLTRLEQPTTGSIKIDGTDINTLDKERLRSFRADLGMIFQHFNLLSSRTALENVCFPLELRGNKNKARGMELLELVGLKQKCDHYPQQLSGGEKQRVAIARALSTHPKILLSDEATSALDPCTTEAILELLRELNQKCGITIVMITHEMDVVKKLCHKMAVLDSGRVVERGAVEDLFAEAHHPLTKEFLQGLSHDVPECFFGENKQLFRLIFKGKSASEPLLSQMIKQFPVDVNILLGGIDVLQTAVVGNLVVEMTGERCEVAEARGFLEKSGVSVESL